MVNMPWNKNRTRPSAGRIPAEVEEYYQSEHKERRGVAWLLMLTALVLTLLIAIGLFFGGKWIYRTVFDKDGSGSKSGASTQQTIDDEDKAPEPPKTDANASTQGATPSSSGDDSSRTQNTPQNTSPSVNQDTNNTTSPVTGPETPEIPRTGPTEE